MEPILDETSIVPCPSWSPAARVLGLARTLQAFDGLGAPRVLRSVRDAADTKLTGGAGARLYFRAVRTTADTVVLVGYFGDHLPTVRYRT